MTGCPLEVNNTFVRSLPGFSQGEGGRGEGRGHCGFIIGLLEARLSPIDLFGLPV